VQSDPGPGQRLLQLLAIDPEAELGD
jgi:hypothetical protein